MSSSFVPEVARILPVPPFQQLGIRVRLRGKINRAPERIKHAWVNSLLADGAEALVKLLRAARDPLEQQKSRLTARNGKGNASKLTMRFLALKASGTESLPTISDGRFVSRFEQPVDEKPERSGTEQRDCCRSTEHRIKRCHNSVAWNRKPDHISFVLGETHAKRVSHRFARKWLRSQRECRGARACVEADIQRIDLIVDVVGANQTVQYRGPCLVRRLEPFLSGGVESDDFQRLEEGNHPFSALLPRGSCRFMSPYF